MQQKGEPWYLHAGLYVIILILVYLLIRVAIVEPQEVMEKEKYFKAESRLRMVNLREAENLWQSKFGKYTDKLDSLITFLKSSPLVEEAMNKVDSITGRPANPFVKLSNGEYSWDSLAFTPKSHQPYTLKIDTSTNYDTVIDRRGKIVRIDSTIKIGSRYLIEDPDGYGKIGDLYNDALKNTASWE
ncbi:hypothetical protein ABRY23_11920 [Melioribacteraceae bacterium 4301-Me]|uniref:hypothetical protein n=1 Tax=Pyranulibacter aquaticus TaxID=3163344 RepID=UPI00359B8B06